MSFGMIKWSKNKEKMQNYVTWIQTVSLFTWKVMIFKNTLLKMLKQDLILQIMNLTEHYWKERTKKLSGVRCKNQNGLCLVWE